MSDEIIISDEPNLRSFKLRPRDGWKRARDEYRGPGFYYELVL
jgi:hypothetical protein